MAPIKGLASLSAGNLRALLGLGVELDALFFLVGVGDGVDEDLEGLGTALFEHLVAGLVEVLGDLVGAGLLLVDNLGHHAVALRV